MKKITIELSDELIIKLKAYAKASNLENKQQNILHGHNYRTNLTYKDVIYDTLYSGIDFNKWEDDKLYNWYKAEIKRLSGLK